MKKVLITGAKGQLGSCIQQVIKETNPNGFQFIFKDVDELDLTNESSVESFFFTNHFDFCVNCAAYTAVDLAEQEVELAFKVNADAVALLAKECKEQNAKFIHISTDYVFDGNSEIAYSETDRVNPQSVYGKSKLEGERQAFDKNPNTMIIRTAWVYSHYGKNFVKTMQSLMQERDELSVVSDQFGSPTNAADLAKAIVNIIVDYKITGGVYHYSNQGKISWYDFAKAIADLNGYKTKINPIATEEYPTPAKRPKFSLLDTSKIKEEFDVEVPNWKDSLEKHFHKKP